MTRSDHADVAAVRALTHPLRLELLDLLRFEGPSTATLLARRVGESSGATSYHLRQLARYGYIEEERRSGRERWWRQRERQVAIPEGGGQSSHTLLAELLSREAHALERFLTERSRLPEWSNSGFFLSRAFRLTVSELDELQHGIESLLSPLRRGDAGDAPRDALPVRLLAFGFPQPLEES
jgi:DNA-binding transcriptional ArsR family regulator